MKNPILLFLLFGSSFIFKAQWNALPPAIGPYTGPNACFLSLTVPNVILPVGDGKLLYTTDCQKTPSSGGEVFVQVSKNDMSSMQIKLNNSGIGCCPLGSIYAYNDSTYSYITSYTGISQVKLIQNDFSIITSLNTYPLPAGKATSISPNLVYSIFQNGMGDSMKVFKSNKTGTSITRKSNFLFNVIPDKLQFINDSTGFTLAVFKSNSSKTALLKTVDYGTTWMPCFTDSIDPIRDYHILPTGKAYLVKQSGAIHYSQNEGNSWATQNSAPLGNYFAIRFLNDSCGYVGGTSGTLFKTTNYCTTWASEISNTTLQIDRIFAFGNVAYFVDAAKKVFKNTSLIQLSCPPVSFIPCTSNSSSVSLSISSSGGAPYSISIQTPTCTSSYTTSSMLSNPTFSFSCPGNYTFTVKDATNFSLGSKTHSVILSTVFNPTITSVTDTICVGLTIYLDFVTSTSTYTISPFLWNIGLNYTPIPVNPIGTYNYVVNGLFTSLTKTCNVSGFKTIFVKPCVGIAEISNTSNIKFFPNPVKETLFILDALENNSQSEIEVLNPLGQLILKTPFKKEIDLQSLNYGLYILKIIRMDKQVLYSKFIKE